LEELDGDCDDESVGPDLEDDGNQRQVNVRVKYHGETPSEHVEKNEGHV